jgi:hypothetical protein
MLSRIHNWWYGDEWKKEVTRGRTKRLKSMLCVEGLVEGKDYAVEENKDGVVIRRGSKNIVVPYDAHMVYCTVGSEDVSFTAWHKKLPVAIKSWANS